jgi:hypothetical protein
LKNEKAHERQDSSERPQAVQHFFICLYFLYHSISKRQRRSESRYQKDPAHRFHLRGIGYNLRGRAAH